MRHQEDPAPLASGLGLRTKLTLGFVLLLAILLAVGVASISLLDRLGGAIDVILRENYKSVIACDQMKEALERMDSGALFALAGDEAQGRGLVTQHRPRFEEALKTELGNLTLPGEGERAARIQRLYGAYGPVLQQILDPAVPAGQRRGLYFRRLYPTFQQIKGTADEILQMNERNMVAAKDHARRVADDATRIMALLLLAGIAFAGAAVVFLSRAILGPLERLTRAAGEIEKGNLDLTVPVASRDELGALAAAFNSMAGGLRELRETDQARLLRSRRISQSALDRLPEAVAVLSPDRAAVELANQAASSELGLRPGEPVPERHQGWLLPLLDRLESGRKIQEGAEPVVRIPVEGRERLFLPRGAVLRDQQGHVEGVVLTMEDATDRLRGGEVHSGLLANAARDLERSLAPLREALGSLEGERVGPLTPHQKQRLESARAEVDRVGQVAAHLLATSGLEESRRQLHPEPVLPGELVAAAAQDAAPGFREEAVKLAVDVNPEAPRVLADRERIRLALSSLLRNARAHSSAGGTVTVNAEPWEGRVRFAVTDAGPGIPAVHLERIFEPFYQVPGAPDVDDAGLGLAIAQGIVQSHGGEIHCESAEGRGSTFWFTLPTAMD